MRNRANGKIEYRFFIGEKRYSVYGSTVMECRKKELAKRETVNKHEKQCDFTVSEYFDKWIESKRNSKRRPVKSATIRTYQKLINRINRQKIGKTNRIFGNMLLTDLKMKTIEQLQESLLNDGLTTRTTNDSISLLKQMFETAYYEDIIDKNPAKGVKSVNRTEKPTRDTIHRSLTREETETFLQAARDSWYYPLYIFLLYTGLRIGEASALTIRDITESYIKIYKTVTRTEYSYIIAEQTKTDAGRRTINTRPEAWEAVQKQRKYNELLNNGKVLKIDNPIFTLPKGGIIRPDRVNSDIKRICKTVNIDYFTCHAFRSTFASRCIASGMPVKILMEILGHTDVQMTLGLYGHAEDKQKKESIMSVSV